MTVRDLAPIAVLIGLLALVPLVVTSNTILNFLVFTLVIALAAHGWNLLGGFGGQFSFGHAAFFWTGAYATALLHAASTPGRDWRLASRPAGWPDG